MGRPPARKASTKSATAAVVKTVATSGSSTKTTKFGGTKKETADVLAKVETVTKVTVTKRKAATAVVAYADEDTENESPVEEEEKKQEKETDKKPAPKKRKIKGAAKEEDNMPLAERTVIASLKRSMYIGAHVSGAGGKNVLLSCLASSQGFAFLTLLISF